jgi:hypothetical protein
VLRRGRPGGEQVPGGEGLAGLGDGQDVPGRLRGDRRVRLLRGAGVCFADLGGPAGGGWVGLPGVRRLGGGAARAGGIGGRIIVGRGSRRGGRLPAVGEAGPAALDPGGGRADPGAPGDHRDGRPAGFGRQRGQDGRCEAAARRRGNGAGPGSVAVSAALWAVPGTWFLVRAMIVNPFPILRSDPGICPEFPGARRSYLPFSKAVNAFPPRISQSPRQFLSDPPLTVADLITVHPLAFSRRHARLSRAFPRRSPPPRALVLTWPHASRAPGEDGPGGKWRGE